MTIFALLFGVVACQQKPKGLSVQTSVRVEASFFRQNCAICHGKEAEGFYIGVKEVPSLRTGAVVQKSDEHLLNQITAGGNGMPAFKHQLTEAQIKNMVEFIRDLQKGSQ